MNFNYQKARDLMVENQLRPNKIKDPIILNLFKERRKEIFLPENLEYLSYSDKDINLSNNRGYLKNLHVAQLIKHADINKEQKVLHIGALTGYVTSLLADLSLEVYAIEEDKIFSLALKKNIDRDQIENVKILDESFKKGSPFNGPFDRIFVDCPINRIDENILNQLSNNLGQIIMIENCYENLNKAFKIVRNKNNFSKEFLFDVFSSYRLYDEVEGFIF